MKTTFKFRLSGYLHLLMCIVLLSSCSTDVLEQEETYQTIEEKEKKLQPIETEEGSRSYTENSCETLCILEGGWDVPKKRGYKSVNVGKETKEMSYTVYNTDTHFVVEVTYEITSENAKVEALISITVHGEEKISDKVKSGTTVTHSFVLPGNYRACDEINYNIKQVAYGEPVTFTGVYKLIPTCEETAVLRGQKRYGGIIVYILQPGDPGYEDDVTHGLVQAPTDLPETLPWSEEIMYTGTTNTLIGGGMENTLNIIGFQGEGTYAAKACADLVLNGYDDWYLPNSTEIYYGSGNYSWDNIIEYWTSHSLSEESAKIHNFDPFGISPFGANKKKKLYVRPFRSF